MIIITSAVESYEFEAHKIFDLSRSWINHSYNRISFTCCFPINQKQIRKNLDVIEYKSRITTIRWCRRLFRLKLHLINKFDTVVSLVGTAGTKCKNCILEIRDIILHPTRICIFESLIDKVYTRLSCSVILLVKIPLYDSPQCLFAFHPFKIYHFTFSFHR